MMLLASHAHLESSYQRRRCKLGNSACSEFWISAANLGEVFFLSFASTQAKQACVFSTASHHVSQAFVCCCREGVPCQGWGFASSFAGSWMMLRDSS